MVVRAGSKCWKLRIRGTFFLCKVLFKNKVGAQNICSDIYLTFLLTHTVSVPCIRQGKLMAVAIYSAWFDLPSGDSFCLQLYIYCHAPVAMTTCTIKMKFNSVDRELNRLHVGIEVSFIRASFCACAAKFWNLIRKTFNNCRFYGCYILIYWASGRLALWLSVFISVCIFFPASWNGLAPLLFLLFKNSWVAFTPWSPYTTTQQYNTTHVYIIFNSTVRYHAGFKNRY